MQKTMFLLILLLLSTPHSQILFGNTYDLYSIYDFNIDITLKNTKTQKITKKTYHSQIPTYDSAIVTQEDVTKRLPIGVSYDSSGYNRPFTNGVIGITTNGKAICIINHQIYDTIQCEILDNSVPYKILKISNPYLTISDTQHTYKTILGEQKTYMHISQATHQQPINSIYFFKDKEAIKNWTYLKLPEYDGSSSQNLSSQTHVYEFKPHNSSQEINQPTQLLFKFKDDSSIKTTLSRLSIQIVHRQKGPLNDYEGIGLTSTFNSIQFTDNYGTHSLTQTNNYGTYPCTTFSLWGKLHENKTLTYGSQSFSFQFKMNNIHHVYKYGSYSKEIDSLGDISVTVTKKGLSAKELEVGHIIDLQNKTLITK
jgi:hypothetical protein